MKPLQSLSVHCRKRRDRGAITIIELIVVAALFAVLVGLLAGGVQRVRERASRLVCQDNLRQTALALHLYHSTNRAFPYGTTPDDSRETMPFLSWHARLLPFLDLDAHWNGIEEAYKIDRDFRRVPPHVLRSRVIPTFLCPIDPRSSAPSTMIHPQVALTSYLGVQGIDVAAKDGILFLGSHVALSDIHDGTSSTLMIGERPPSWDDLYGWWYAGWGAQKCAGSAGNGQLLAGRM